MLHYMYIACLVFCMYFIP